MVGPCTRPTFALSLATVLIAELAVALQVNAIYYDCTQE